MNSETEVFCMSKAAKKKTKVPKITEEEYAEYIASLKTSEINSVVGVTDVLRETQKNE